MAKKDKVVSKPQVDNKQKVQNTPLIEKRNGLISELQSKLLTKRQLKEGGPGVRMRSLRESAYQAVVDEINDLGKKLGLAPVGLGSIRRA